jgi:hypothetical protein
MHKPVLTLSAGPFGEPPISRDTSGPRVGNSPMKLRGGKLPSMAGDGPEPVDPMAEVIRMRNSSPAVSSNGGNRVDVSMGMDSALGVQNRGRVMAGDGDPLGSLEPSILGGARASRNLQAPDGFKEQMQAQVGQREWSDVSWFWYATFVAHKLCAICGICHGQDFPPQKGEGGL